MFRPLNFLVLIIALLSTACSSVQIASPQQHDPIKASLDAEKPDRFWWQFRFKLLWPEGEQPDFSRHLLIADQILAPVLTEYGEDIALWRFHRRAGRGPTGHQFSLILYADETTANSLATSIDAEPLTQWLISQNMIEATRFDRRTTQELAALEDTSDDEWPIEIQRSWPYFIMGVSQSWLSMVQELSAKEPMSGSVDYAAFLAHYQSVNDSLNEQWRDFGQHAYLHHLSAVFGYQPIKLRHTEYKTF